MNEPALFIDLLLVFSGMPREPRPFSLPFEKMIAIPQACYVGRATGKGIPRRCDAEEISKFFIASSKNGTVERDCKLLNAYAEEHLKRLRDPLIVEQVDAIATICEKRK